MKKFPLAKLRGVMRTVPKSYYKHFSNSEQIDFQKQSSLITLPQPRAHPFVPKDHPFFVRTDLTVHEMGPPKTVRTISQEAFDEVVKENMEDLGMDPTEALQDAIQTLSLQGVDLSGNSFCLFPLPRENRSQIPISQTSLY